MSNDPVSFTGPHNFNRYAYAANNPYTFIDPDGKNCTASVVGVECSNESSLGHGPSLNSDLGRSEAKEARARKIDAQKGGRSANAARLREKQHQALLKGAQDGHITLAEANAWRAEGSGNPLTADLSRIDLSQVSVSEFPNGVGSTESIDLFLRSADGNVYGHISLTLISPTEVIAQTPDVYNFFYGRNNNSLGNVAANAANLVGEIHANSYSMPGRTPADFRINFTGVGTIQP